MALTQIHGNRQILDGTIKDADIATDAAITNGKLDLATIAQAVKFIHANGVRLEAAGTGGNQGVVLRNTSFGIDTGGLWSLHIDGGGVRFGINVAPAGTFAPHADPFVLTRTALTLDSEGAGTFTAQIAGRLFLNGSAAQLILSGAATTDLAASNVLRRDVAGRLIWRDGGGVDQTLSYLSDPANVNSATVSGGLRVKGLATPAAPTVTPQGAVGTTTWGYRVTAVGANGETLVSAEGTTTAGNATLSVTDFNRITWSAVAGAKEYNVYRTTAGGTPGTTGKIGTTTATTFDDTGLAASGSLPQFDYSDNIVIEHAEPQLWFRNTALALPSGLWRYRTTGGNFALERNTAAAGDFSTVATVFNIASPAGAFGADLNLTGIINARAFQVNGTGFLEGTYYFSSFQTAGNVSGGGIFQGTEAIARLHYKSPQDNVDHVLSYTTEVPSVAGTTNRLAKFTGASSLGNSQVTDDGAAVQIDNADVRLQLRETDQALPAGLYRLRLAGDSVRFERNTALAGDFSLLDLDIEIQSNNISVNKPLSLFADLAISKADAQLRMRETDQTLPAGLWRLRLDVDQLTVEKNTAASGDFSTADVPLRFFGTNVIVVRTERFQMSNTAIQFTEYTGPAHGNILYRDGVGFLKFNNGSGQSRRVLFHESVVVRETPVGAVDGVNTIFTLSAVPLDNSEQVYLNGILQSPGATEDYTMASGTITFNNPPQSGDKIRVTYIKSTL